MSVSWKIEGAPILDDRGRRTPSSPAQYGMGRLAEAEAGRASATFRAFKGDLEAAMAWTKGGAS